MLVYYFVPFIVSNRYLLFRDSNGRNSVTVQNRTHVYMNFFDHKDLGNHLLQLCPKVVKHPVYSTYSYRTRYCYRSHELSAKYINVIHKPQNLRLQLCYRYYVCTYLYHIYHVLMCFINSLM